MRFILYYVAAIIWLVVLGLAALVVLVGFWHHRTDVLLQWFWLDAKYALGRAIAAL